MLLNLYLSYILLSSLPGNAQNHSDTAIKRISVIGIAEDDKDAATVETSKGYYIIDGLDEWDKKYYHKKVKVTGILVTKIHKKQSTDSQQVQERIGTWQIIKNAKWSLVK